MSQQAKSTDAKATSTETHPVSDKIIGKLHESVEALSQRAAATEESLRYAAQHGSENLSQKQAEVTSKWNNSSVKQYAIENPVATAGIAFAAGMLFSTFFKNK